MDTLFDTFEQTRTYRFVVAFLKAHGIGWYRYTWYLWTADDAEVAHIITGPYKRQAAAQGPLWFARLYGVANDVKFHFGWPIDQAKIRKTRYDWYDTVPRE